MQEKPVPNSENVQDEEDRTLVARMAEGDEGAFLLFYRRYSPAVYALCYRITGRQHDAEDVVSEVFLELWEKSDRYTPSKSTPYAYLIMLTRCRAVDRKRGLMRRVVHPILEWATDGTSDIAVSGSPADRCMAEERHEACVKALTALDAEQRRAIEMTFFDGLTHRVTAEKLGIPLGTLKGRIRTALQRLRNLLQMDTND